MSALKFITGHVIYISAYTYLQIPFKNHPSFFPFSGFDKNLRLAKWEIQTMRQKYRISLYSFCPWIVCAAKIQFIR